jgi:hypothetical protein
MEDACRNVDFENGLDWVDFVGEPTPCSSGIVLGSLASTPVRIGKIGILVILEGLEISESDADLWNGLAG